MILAHAIFYKKFLELHGNGFSFIVSTDVSFSELFRKIGLGRTGTYYYLQRLFI